MEIIAAAADRWWIGYVGYEAFCNGYLSTSSDVRLLCSFFPATPEDHDTVHRSMRKMKKNKKKTK